jgi:hypothetical protein
MSRIMLARFLPAAAAVVFLLSPLAPSNAAFAASSDAAMLQSYVGSYIGSGTISSSPPQTVRCRLALQSAGTSKVDYTGRCSTGGTSFSMTGAFNAAKGRIEAAMSSSNGMSVTVTGIKRGGGVVFGSTQRDVAQGHDRTITSSFALTGGTVSVDFSVLDNKTGPTTTGTIPFSKVGQ